MRYKNLIYFLSTSAAAFSLGYGSVSCVATGLNLPVNPLLLAVFCMVGALVVGASLSQPRESLALSGVYLMACLFAGFSPTFRQQFRAMCCSITTPLNFHYGIPIPQWAVDHTADSQLLPLLAIACFIMITVLLTVTYRKAILFPIAAALFPVACCVFIPGVLPDMIPFTLLVTGALLTGLTQSTHKKNIHQGKLLTVLLIVPVGFAVIGLILLIPPESYEKSPVFSAANSLLNLLDAPPTQSTAPTDSTFATLPDDPSPPQLQGPNQGSGIVMTVSTNYSGTIYLRGQDYDEYTGLSWNTTPDRTEDGYWLLPHWRASPEFVTIQTTSPAGRFYLATHPTISLTLIGGELPNPEQKSQYTRSFAPLRDDWRDLWHTYHDQMAVPPEVPSCDSRYLQLPEATRLRAQSILSQLSLADNTSDTADIIGRYVSNSARYSIFPETIPQNETDFAMWFLENGNFGYCVHFASSAVVLLRAAGIPARYVEGYLVSTQDGNPTQVLEKNAHSWVEYYLDYVGWVIMDTTPGTSNLPAEPIDPPITPTDPVPPTDPTADHDGSTDTSSPVTTESTIPDSEQTVTPTTDTVPTDVPAPAHPSSATRRFIAASLLLASLTLLIIAQWLLRRFLVYLLLHCGKANQQALKRYRYIKHINRFFRFEIPQEIITLTEKSMFSQHGLQSDELAQYDIFIQKCTQSMKRVSLLQRLFLRYILALR